MFAPYGVPLGDAGTAFWEFLASDAELGPIDVVLEEMVSLGFATIGTDCCFFRSIGITGPMKLDGLAFAGEGGEGFIKGGGGGWSVRLLLLFVPSPNFPWFFVADGGSGGGGFFLSLPPTFKILRRGSDCCGDKLSSLFI